MNIYIDESGDLGWKFDRPYRKGGSSRYLTISYLLTPGDTKKYPTRLIRDFRSHFLIPKNEEVKASRIDNAQREYFIDKTLKMMTDHPEILLHSITVRKENVQTHIRDDGNKLYNYMTKFSIIDELAKYQEALIYPDPRSIKVESGKSFQDYMHTVLWFEKSAPTKLTIHNIPSDKCLNLQFVDIVANTIWRKFEFGIIDPADRLMAKMRCKHLFF